MVNRRAADPAMAAELRSEPIVAGDLPESAQKFINGSNQVVDAIASKVSQDLALDQRKTVDAVLKEAEAAQRKGELDQMIAHQHQAANLNKEVPGLSKPASVAIESYRKSRSKVIAKAAGDVVAERKKLAQSLAQVQKDETKKGNTTGALAIKSAIESINKGLVDASAANLAGQKEAIRPFAIKPEGGVYLGNAVSFSKNTLISQ